MASIDLPPGFISFGDDYSILFWKCIPIWVIGHLRGLFGSAGSARASLSAVDTHPFLCYDTDSKQPHSVQRGGNMIHLTNGILSAEISEIGAEIKSLKKDGCEYMWSGDPQVWGNTAPVLFPIIGFMKDNRYTLDGTTYEMTKHGLVRGKEFAVENVTDTSVTLLHTHNEQTMQMYPFAFEFRVIFTLVDHSLKVEYRVNNLNDREMYFSTGSHEAYATPEGVENYDIIFPHKEDLETYLLAGGLLQKKTMTVGKNTEYLPIYETYFALDTLIFKHLRSKALILKNRKTERTIQVEFPDCDYLGIWHKPGAPYLCIEPWAGLPDNEDTDQDITGKEGIIALPPHKEYSNIHTITV